MKPTRHVTELTLDPEDNTRKEQMKMFLTRLGRGSKTIVAGDITQTDLEGKKPSGLILMETILKSVSDIAFVYLNTGDVVRHPLVKKIVDAYEAFEKKNGHEPQT